MGEVAAIESPCVRICAIHPAAGICEGCGRTLAEIAGWSRLAPAEHRQVMAALPARLARLAGAP